MRKGKKILYICSCCEDGNLVKESSRASMQHLTANEWNSVKDKEEVKEEKAVAMMFSSMHGLYLFTQNRFCKYID